MLRVGMKLLHDGLCWRWDHLAWPAGGSYGPRASYFVSLWPGRARCPIARLSVTHVVLVTARGEGHHCECHMGFLNVSQPCFFIFLFCSFPLYFRCHL